MASNTVIGVIVLFVSLFCSHILNPSEYPQWETDIAARGHWINPTIVCVLKPGERPMKQYPFDHGISSRDRTDTAGFYDFCFRMERRFDSSCVSIVEANLVYTAIYREKIIQDASYGMPGSNARKKKKLSIEEIKQRVSIKKGEEGEYEIFYTQTGCGTQYKHELIALRDKQIEVRMSIESWKGSYPC